MTAPVIEGVGTGTELAYCNLISGELWNRLVSRIVIDENMERPVAERIMNEALGFLLLCSKEPDGKYSPSKMVDIGWHTFLMYTVGYAEFCTRVAGRFLHHEPTDVPGVDYTGANDSSRTQVALRAYGPVDDTLWASAADCNDSGCHSSCGNSGCNQAV